VALVTGASSGIGYALAEVLASPGEGYAVGLLARRTDRLETLHRAIEAAGGRAVVVAADVSDRAAMHEAVRQVEAELGPIDLFVANAGITVGIDALAPDADAFRREVDVNLLGVFYGIEAVVPSMRERGCGHIVAISSLASRRGFAGAAGYCATKAGLNVLMEALRVDWEPAGIRATTVLPGFVHSEITAGKTHALPFVMSAEKAARKIARAIRRGKHTYAFPWPMALATRILGLMPDWAMRRYARDRRDPPASPGSS
jgi:NADP-dependent 3-hydroxy acid dehydrogenase YdfG